MPRDLVGHDGFAAVVRPIVDLGGLFCSPSIYHLNQILDFLCRLSVDGQNRGSNGGGCDLILKSCSHARYLSRQSNI
jgi:hypothetical protein